MIVVNAEKVRLTGTQARAEDLLPPHRLDRARPRSTTADKILDGTHPERVIEEAVRGMLPKNSLGRKLLRKLKVYAGPAHPARGPAAGGAAPCLSPRAAPPRSR